MQGIRVSNKISDHIIFAACATALTLALASAAGEGNPEAGGAKFLGNQSCSTSGCHGGAGPIHGTLTKFQQEDRHVRALGTLATPRSARMGEALKIPDVTTSLLCTSCHAPVFTVPVEFRAEDLKTEEGIGCASCHQSTGSWLRTHTRTDLNHLQKVAAGMRDLRSAYARANACVACHQVIQPELVEIGRHPRLIFELDGQLASEPPHWSDPAASDGGRTWIVGQAVAWREAAAARSSGRDGSKGALERENALAWLVPRAFAADASSGPKTPDEFARDADKNWGASRGIEGLRRLAAASDDFLDPSVAKLEQAYRAERLVLGLDRLLAALPDRKRAETVSDTLDRLFDAAQSIEDFDPGKFANLLAEFSAQLNG
jgi:hypothetical protein